MQNSVLIIDDDEVDRYLLKRLLKESSFDFKVFEKQDGTSALEFLKNRKENKRKYADAFPPVIMFLDINMPMMSGHEFLREFAEMRDLDDNRTCVIMMFSSSERPGDRAMILEYDFVKDYLVKGSFTAADLNHRIESVLGSALA